MTPLAGLVFLAAVAAGPVLAQAPELTLQCPDKAAGFALQGREDGRCAYSRPSGARISVGRGGSGNAAPEGEGVARLGIPAPHPFEGDVYHLGESENGDRRVAIWRAGPAPARLEIEARYVIPRTPRADISAFALALAAANGLAAGPDTAGVQAECPAPPAGFRIAERLTGEQAGAAVRWSCAYLKGDVFAFFYAPRDPALALSSFEAQLSAQAASAGPFQDLPAARRLVEDKGVYRGLWTAGEGAGARAMEVDWVSEDQRADVAALVRALF